MLPSTMEAFHPPAFLSEGTPRQQAAFEALERLDIFTRLHPFDARLAGTVPLDVDLPGSDLDILCAVQHPASFIEKVMTHYGAYPDFAVHHTAERILIRFTAHSFPIEIFAATIPTPHQRAWVHMMAEWYLLQQGGPAAHHAIRRLKAAGMKTEPAFARYFRLSGDPYQVLYQLGMQVMQRYGTWTD